MAGQVIESFIKYLHVHIQAIEEAAKNGKMTVVGTADLDKSRLKQLFDYAKVSLIVHST